MKIGRNTAKLVRQAAVMGFVHGMAHGSNRSWDDALSDFPADSVIVANVLHAAQKDPQFFPTLAKVESVDAEADAAEGALRANSDAQLQEMLRGIDYE